MEYANNPFHAVLYDFETLGWNVDYSALDASAEHTSFMKQVDMESACALIPEEDKLVVSARVRVRHPFNTEGMQLLADLKIRLAENGVYLDWDDAAYFQLVRCVVQPDFFAVGSTYHIFQELYAQIDACSTIVFESLLSPPCSV